MKKIAILAILILFLVGCVLAQGAVTQETTVAMEGTVTPGTETASSPVLSDADCLLLFYVLTIIGILIVLPWFVTMYWGFHIRNKIMEDIRHIQDMDEKRRCYEMVLTPFPERRGTSRYSLMLAVTLIVGTVVPYLVVKNPDSELLKSTVGVLTGALASIIGFFFGGRAVESGTENGHLPPRPSRTPTDTSKDTLPDELTEKKGST